MASWRTEPRATDGEWWCFRQVAADWPPLYHAAGEPAPSQRSGRWHREGDGYAQYLSLDPLGSWAELIRYASIASVERSDQQRRNLWLVFVRGRRIADLARFEDFERAGLDPRIAVDEHGPAQELAAELRDAGFNGVLAPGAALPGTTNLTLFGERYERLLRGGLSAWENPRPAVWLPCTLAAADAAPPAEVVEMTCRRGAPHAGYRAYLHAAGLPRPRRGP